MALLIRTLRRNEDQPVRELYEHLSPRTRYLRFLSVPAVLPDDTLRRLISLDGGRQLAMVAEHEDEDGRSTIGHASFVAIDGRHAEIGIVVRDDWQGRRVGTALARTLIQAAEARGLDHFVAYVDANNTAVQRFLRRIGDVVSRRLDGHVWELLFVRREVPAPLA